MIGHEGIATALVQLLRDRGAAAARTVEQEMGIPAGEIATPAAEDIHPMWIDVVSKGRFPTWMVMAQDTPLRRTAHYSDMDGVGDETQWQYPFLIATHVVGRDEYETGLLRYRLMLVVRTVLIQTKLLVKTPTEKAQMQLDDMQEVVGGMAQNEGRYLLEGRNQFHVSSIEITPAVQRPWGPLAGTETAGGLL